MPQPKNATRTRPDMPDYGLTPEETSEMLTWDWIEEQMEKSRNYWVCTTRADGHPHAVPVWGVWVDSKLYFSTGRKSVKGRNIARDNHVVVHLESGDETLIVEGVLEESNEPTLRKRIYTDYHQKYKFNPEPTGEDDGSGVWYELVPHKIMAWLESEFLKSAAYWIFDVK